MEGCHVSVLSGAITQGSRLCFPKLVAIPDIRKVSARNNFGPRKESLLNQQIKQLISVLSQVLER